MIAFFSISLALSSFAQQKPDATPFMRLTGRNGAFVQFNEMRRELAGIPLRTPEPQILRDGSTVFSNGKSVRTVFDQTYPSLRTLIAKRQLIEMVLRAGPHSTFALSSMPPALAEELREAISNLYPDCVALPDSVIEIQTSMTTAMKLPKTEMSISQNPQMDNAAEADKAAAVERDKHPFTRSEKQAQQIRDRDEARVAQPTVKIFSENYRQFRDISAEQRRAIEQFDDWAKKESHNLDDRLFHDLERQNAWKSFAELYRCRTFRDLAQASPTSYQQLSRLLTGNYKSLGYANEDALRTEIDGIALSSAATFGIIFSFGDGRIGRVEFP